MGIEDKQRELSRRERRRKKKRERILIKFAIILIGILILAVFLSYVISDEAHIAEDLVDKYNSLGEGRVSDSKQQFSKKLQFITVYTDENGQLKLSLGGDVQTDGTGNEDDDDDDNDDSPSDGTDIEVPNDYWAYVKDVGVSDNGVKSSITVSINGTSVNLYDGIPKEWNANLEQSHIIFYDKVENAWRAGYKQAFGHDYPNPVKKGSWTNDSIYNKYSTIAKDTFRSKFNITTPVATYKSGESTYYKDSAWLSDGVLCVGFCPNPFMATHEFQWDGTGSAGVAYDYRWLIVLEQNGKYMYLPALGCDGMSHMWPGACYQTFVSHQTDSSTYDFPAEAGDYRSDWGVSMTDKLKALERLESGNASPRHKTNKNNTVQYKLEGVRLNSLNSCGWNFYGVICVK